MNTMRSLLCVATILAASLSSSGVRSETFFEKADKPDHALAAIIAGVDDIVCSATVIGPRHVLTAADCVIDPETGAPFEDRAVMPRVDLAGGAIPVARRFINRVFLPDADAPFGPGAARDNQLAVVEVRRSAEQTAFAEVTDRIGFHYGQAGSDEALAIAFYDAENGSQMISLGCAALMIEAGDLMPLSCSLPKGAEGAALRSGSGIAAIYLGPGRGRYIGKAEAAAIGRIVSGQPPGAFTALEAGYQPLITLVLANRCEQPISYVARYRAPEAPKNVPFASVSGTIDGGHSALLPLGTQNGVIYLRGATRDGSLIWGGEDRFDGEGYFKIAIADWGDHFHALGCAE